MAAALALGASSSILACHAQGADEPLAQINFASEFSSAWEIPSGTVRYIDYAPLVFRRLRRLWSLEEHTYLAAICEMPLRDRGTSAGKSGQRFLESADRSIIFKTITKAELKALLEMLPDYLAHIDAYPDSLLPRFYGVAELEINGERLVVMASANVFRDAIERAIDERYDLKGSKVGRCVTEAEKTTAGVTLKDLDLAELNKRLHLKRGAGIALTLQIKADCELLTRFELMDYSLLVGISHALQDTPKNTSQLNLLSQWLNSCSSKLGEAACAALTKHSGTSCCSLPLQLTTVRKCSHRTSSRDTLCVQAT